MDEGFPTSHLSIFQLSDIEKWTRRDTDQHMLQLGGRAPCKAAAHRFSEILRTQGKADSLGFSLGVCDLADEDGVLRVADVTLLVHVGGGDGEQAAVVVEGQRGDAGRVPVELTQALLVERVPDVHEAVRATWGKERLKVNVKRFRRCVSAQIWIYNNRVFTGATLAVQC